jgi:Right handed beta helix region
MKLMTIPIRFLLPIRPDLGRTSVRAGLLACLPVFALLAAGPVHAATLTVCPSGCDFTAIQPAVDSALSGDTIRISSGVFPGFVRIIDKSFVLQGDGASRTMIEPDDPFFEGPLVMLSCSQRFRITIQDLAITKHGVPNQNGLGNGGCKLKLKNSAVTGHGGAGISHEGGTLSIEDSVVANNALGISVGSGTGTLIRSTVIHNSFKVGGGIFIGESGTLRVHRSIISNNGSFNTGGITNDGKLVVTQSVITNNGAGGPGSSTGGGIVNSGVATLTHSVIADNVAERGDGGGIFNSGKLTLIRSTVLSNRASCDESQGCSPPPGGRGGGIFNAGSAASASLIGSFITSNSALDGGGVFNEGGTVSQTNTLIINNNPNDCVGC